MPLHHYGVSSATVIFEDSPVRNTSGNSPMATVKEVKNVEHLKGLLNEY